MKTKGKVTIVLYLEIDTFHPFEFWQMAPFIVDQNSNLVFVIKTSCGSKLCVQKCRQLYLFAYMYPLYR